MDDDAVNNKKSLPVPAPGTPDWNKYIAECEDNYFLKHEVKRLMRMNDGLEWRAQLAYAFGFGDAKADLDFDSEFCVDDVQIEQDDDTQWTAQTRDLPPLVDSEDETDDE